MWHRLKLVLFYPILSVFYIRLCFFPDLPHITPPPPAPSLTLNRMTGGLTVTWFCILKYLSCFFVCCLFVCLWRTCWSGALLFPIHHQSPHQSGHFFHGDGKEYDQHGESTTVHRRRTIGEGSSRNDCKLHFIEIAISTPSPPNSPSFAKVVKSKQNQKGFWSVPF